MKKFILCTILLIILLVSPYPLPAEKEPLPSSAPMQHNKISDFDENHLMDLQKAEDITNYSVFISPTGKKYHHRSTCAGKNAIPIYLETAKNYYAPCKKCVS
ncbi:MAG: hypothetical protein E7407_01335 [Ruminococcaceae bacterium]|nr:hypothetical protein [Oscillospiraceae bacterium]